MKFVLNINDCVLRNLSPVTEGQVEDDMLTAAHVKAGLSKPTRLRGPSRARSHFSHRRPWVAASAPFLMLAVYHLFMAPEGAGLNGSPNPLRQVIRQDLRALGHHFREDRCRRSAFGQHA